MNKKITVIRSNNIIRTIAIGFEEEENYLILKDVQVYYDTGIVDRHVIQINQNDFVGSSFFSNIESSGVNPRQYKWFQIKTGNNKIFEAVVKTFEFRRLTESDHI